MNDLVFVYGSLKRQFGNHGLLDGSEFLGEYRTIHPQYRMNSMGGFPAVTEGDGYIHGELYRVTPETLRQLDRLEGHPRFYFRERHDVTNDAQEIHSPWMYTIPGQGHRDQTRVMRAPIHPGDPTPIYEWLPAARFYPSL